MRADALRSGIEQLPTEDDGIKLITLSFGVAAMPEDGITREALLSAADSVLYSAKRAGRNRVTGTRSQPQAETKRI